MLIIIYKDVFNEYVDQVFSDYWAWSFFLSLGAPSPRVKERGRMQVGKIGLQSYFYRRYAGKTQFAVIQKTFINSNIY